MVTGLDKILYTWKWIAKAEDASATWKTLCAKQERHVKRIAAQMLRLRRLLQPTRERHRTTLQLLHQMRQRVLQAEVLSNHLKVPDLPFQLLLGPRPAAGMLLAPGDVA